MKPRNEMKSIKVKFDDLIGIFPSPENEKNTVLVLQEKLFEKECRVALTPHQKKKLIKLLEES